MHSLGFKVQITQDFWLKAGFAILAGLANVVLQFEMRDQIVLESRLVAANFALFLVVAETDVLLDVFLVFRLEMAEFAFVGLFGAVFLHVFIEIVLEGGSVVANVAAERLFRIVNSQNVLLQVLQLRGFEAAELAIITTGRF